jgi:hypothetical protein
VVPEFELGPLCCGYFEGRVSLFAQASLDCAFLLFYAICHHWDDRHANTTSSFFSIEVEISQTFFAQAGLKLRCFRSQSLA